MLDSSYNRVYTLAIQIKKGLKKIMGTVVRLKDASWERTALAQTLYEARQSQGFTLEQVSERSNGKISPKYLSQIERAEKTTPSENKLRVLADIYHLNPERLIFLRYLASVPESIRHLLMPRVDEQDSMPEWFQRYRVLEKALLDMPEAQAERILNVMEHLIQEWPRNKQVKRRGGR